MTALTLAFLLLPHSAPVEYAPAETKVALIPIVNASGETWADAKTKQASRGDEELHALFEEHGFAIVPDDTVKKAVADLHVDLSDEEQQKRDTLYKIG